MRRSVLVVAVAALACGGPGRVPRKAVDEGQPCVFARKPTSSVIVSVQPPHRFVAGAPLHVGVTSGCLSSSCSSDRASRCTITREGTKLTVTSETSWVDVKHDRCTADCQRAFATCETEPLPAGEYTLAFGRRAMTVQIPAERAGPLCMPR
jgi:hypothetical protein